MVRGTKRTLNIVIHLSVHVLPVHIHTSTGNTYIRYIEWADHLFSLDNTIANMHAAPY